MLSRQRADRGGGRANAYACNVDASHRLQEAKEAGKEGGEGGGDADEEGGAAVPRPTPHVVVIGATNRPDSLDTALRCGEGRSDAFWSALNVLCTSACLERFQ